MTESSAPRTPRLSVLMGCHQATVFFRETMDSLLAVLGPRDDVEILIGDDGSPAGGDGDTAREYARRHPRLLRVVRHGAPHGIAAVYGHLAAEARGTYLMPFDSDDILLPFDLNEALAELDEHPEIAANFGKKRLFDSSRGDLGVSHGGDYSTFAMTFNPRAVHNAMIIRAADFRTSGGYTPPVFAGHIFRAAPDVAMWAGLGLLKPLRFRDEYRLLYRMHPDQNTVRQSAQYAADYREMRSLLALRYPELHAAIAGETAFRFPAALRAAAGMLYGAVFAEAGAPSDRTLRLLTQARRVLPGDYAIDEYRIRTLIALNRNREALEAAEAYRLDYAASPYVALTALDFILEIAPKLGLDTALVRELREKLALRFFRLSPEQSKILQQATSQRNLSS